MMVKRPIFALPLPHTESGRAETIGRKDSGGTWILALEVRVKESGLKSVLVGLSEAG